METKRANNFFNENIVAICEACGHYTDKESTRHGLCESCFEEINQSDNIIGYRKGE